MIQTRFAFPHQVQNLSLRSSARTSRNTRLSSQRTWMNQSGPVPEKAMIKYFPTAGTPSNTPSLSATAVLKYPTIQWNTSKPMVPGTSSFRVRALNHSFAEYLSSAYRALIPARMNSSGMKKGYRMYMTTSWYCGHCG